MPCTKSELVSAINSYANARATQDGSLIAMAANALQVAVDSLEFTVEEAENGPEVQEN